jgi:hypothetical protein
MQPTSKFGELFQYSNLMAAGRIHGCPCALSATGRRPRL